MGHSRRTVLRPGSGSRERDSARVAGARGRDHVRRRSVHARRRLGLSRAERRRALDAARARAARAGRRHAGGARRGRLGDRHRRALAQRRAPRHRLRDARLGALRARRGRRPRARARLLVSLHERRRAEPGRPHAHGRGTRHAAEPHDARRRVVPALRARPLRGVSRHRGRRARRRRSRRRLHLRRPRHEPRAHARRTRVPHARGLSAPLRDLQVRSASAKPRTRPGRGCSSPTITRSRTTTPAEHSGQDDPPELFLARRAAAYQAYYEHLPLPRRARAVRRPAARSTRAARSAISRPSSCSTGASTARRRRARRGRSSSRAPSSMRASARCSAPAQEQWLRRALGASTARWNLLGQQTLLAHFDQSGDGPRAYWADGWNGYPAARERLIETLLRRGPPRIPSSSAATSTRSWSTTCTRVATDYDSPIVATELVTSSISSQGQPQATFDRWKAENPNVQLARSDHRGYVRVAVAPEQLHADLVAVDDVTRADSATHVLAAFDVESGKLRASCASNAARMTNPSWLRHGRRACGRCTGWRLPSSEPRDAPT